MAKKARIITDLTAWVPPPVTKEEALNPYVEGAWQRDGFDGHGGGEPPSEYALDRMVYPHDYGPRESAQLKQDNERRMQAEEFRHEALERSRQFDITPEQATGEVPGPPSSYKKGD